jgi:hypothetical protein
MEQTQTEKLWVGCLAYLGMTARFEYGLRQLGQNVISPMES